MSPLEPLEPIPSDNSRTSGEIPGDKDPASELVEIGRRIADAEMRDAVTEAYVDEANADEDTDEALDDIARAETSADLAEEVGPEGDAIYREMPPED